MGDMQITYEDMRTAAKDLEDGQSDIESKLTTLKNGIDGLVAAGFVTGSASKEFEASYSEFDKGVRQVIEGLHGMGNYLKSAADAYEQTDQELAKALKQ